MRLRNENNEVLFDVEHFLLFMIQFWLKEAINYHKIFIEKVNKRQYNSIKPIFDFTASPAAIYRCTGENHSS